MLRYQWEDAVKFWNSKKREDCERVGTSSKQKQKFTHTAGSKSLACVAEAEDKLKDKKAEYEAIASSDSSVNLENIDNRISTKVLGPESSQQYMTSGSQAQAEVQRLRDQMAQMQASTVEQIAQLKAEAAARETDQNKKYNELQLQLQNMMKMFQQSQNPPS
ncbi:26S protease regulatory subunit 6B [Gossypium arboreum]|uniref:26S protease regulatory subunit 6B n=1 Tax=Gossypium arboreum TaxID=29729 RepID=A0A0B0NJJ6_GOSAR|nr:26S protease regulatory subunit 6B [Gossypium arboreum]